MENRFNIFLSGGESLVKSIVDFSRKSDDPNCKAFYVIRYVTEDKSQAQIEYRIISDLNKNCEDETGIVTKGTVFKFTVEKSSKENDPYIVREQRYLNAEGTDLYQFPTTECFSGQYVITFISEAEFKADIKELFKNIL